MDDFRQQLENLTTPPIPSSQAARIVELSEQFSQTVRPLVTNGSLYNCFMYALGLEDNELIKDTLWQKQRTTITFGIEYVTELINVGVLKEAKDGGIVVYFKGDIPLHAARYLGDKRYSSKWGLGSLWEHGLYEVPSNYGNTCVSYNLTSPEEAVAVFSKYAEKY